MVWTRISEGLLDRSIENLCLGANPVPKSRKEKRRDKPRSFGFEDLDDSAKPFKIDDLVEVRKSLYGGMGLYAKNFFVEGQRIFAESPFLSIAGITEMQGNPHNLWDACRKPLCLDCDASMNITDAVLGLSAEDRELFWTFSQAACYGPAKSAPGIFHTNYIDVTPASGPEIGCMYRYISRINHSCEPNVRWSYIHATHQLVIISVRDLRPGEELLVDYCGHDDTWQGTERKDHLTLFYDFQCQCPLCIGTALATAIDKMADGRP
jgi:hypothetical protein